MRVDEFRSCGVSVGEAVEAVGRRECLLRVLCTRGTRSSSGGIDYEWGGVEVA